ncbi:HAD-IIIC family phosphatase [Micromonospora sp. NPDC048898]|uniref:HAD-IIIC family phosphatase n=1 Tax=Micromonospora sp. NPDC048898 TaxID=3364260 RepID=UPI0037230F15
MTTTPVTEQRSREALGRLRELHREGRLAAEYPSVRPLLSGLDAEDLRTAGRLLFRTGAGEVLAAHPGTPRLRVGVTGHSTLSALIPALTAELARHGCLCDPVPGTFGTWVTDLGDPAGPVRAADPDLLLCVLDAGAIFDHVPVPWTVEDVAEAAAAQMTVLDGLVAGLRQTDRCTVVLNTLPLPRHWPAQLVDHRSRARLGAVWREMNVRLLGLAQQHDGVIVVDLDPLLTEDHRLSDTRQRVYAQVHLSDSVLAAYAREVGHLGRHQLGRGRKCLAVDLDNTLWGGVLGDDGPDGVALADGYHGAAFRGFQRVLRQLGAQGVLLAAVSKNDPEPVGTMLEGHPGMVLRRDDFVRVIANWHPKHDNLTALAADLNIGVDSLVFVDDSAYECGLVRWSLPEVAVIQVGEDPAGHIERLLADGWFDTVELTADDRARPGRYRDELGRKDFLASFSSIDDYLRELGVTVRLSRVTAATADRAAQLSLRTNQFNLTTRRLRPADMPALLADPAVEMFTVESADRFGDNGTVGALFTRRDGDVLHIDNFVLSCRVFARGIEQTCLAAVLRRARAGGLREVRAGYRPTAKNRIVADLYPRHGFARVAGNGDDGDVFSHDLTDLHDPPPHVRLEENLDGEAQR